MHYQRTGGTVQHYVHELRAQQYDVRQEQRTNSSERRHLYNQLLIVVTRIHFVYDYSRWPYGDFTA